MTLKLADLERYEASRGLRGHMLPRGWRKVDRLFPLSGDDESDN